MIGVNSQIASDAASGRGLAARQHRRRLRDLLRHRRRRRSRRSRPARASPTPRPNRRATQSEASGVRSPYGASGERSRGSQPATAEVALRAKNPKPRGRRDRIERRLRRSGAPKVPKAGSSSCRDGASDPGAAGRQFQPARRVSCASTARLESLRAPPDRAAAALIPLQPIPGRLAQLGERRLDKAEVTGSSPVSPMKPKSPRQRAFCLSGRHHRLPLDCAWRTPGAHLTCSRALRIASAAGVRGLSSSSRITPA